MNVLFIGGGLHKQPHLRRIPNTSLVKLDTFIPGQSHLLFSLIRYPLPPTRSFKFLFSLMVFLSFLFSKHCQQHILTISFSFLLQMLTTDYTHKSCSVIGKSPWWYDSFLSLNWKCFAIYGFTFFSSFKKNTLGKESVWRTEEGIVTETLKASWAHSHELHQGSHIMKIFTLGFSVLCGTSNLEKNRSTRPLVSPSDKVLRPKVQKKKPSQQKSHIEPQKGFSPFSSKAQHEV